MDDEWTIAICSVLTVPNYNSESSSGGTVVEVDGKFSLLQFWVAFTCLGKPTSTPLHLLEFFSIFAFETFPVFI